MENKLEQDLAAARGWIFHRNREQPAPDPKEPPLNQIKFYLDRYRIKEALQIFYEENTLNLLRDESDFMWDIIPIICKRLRGLCQYRFRVFEGCEKMLCRIAVDENCNPKEVLISLLAELSHQDQYDDDNVFRAMVRPLEGTLLRMNYPSPRDENYRWVLNVLMRHINDIDLPQEYNLEGKKRLALPNDPSVKRFIEVLPLMLSFIEEFNGRPLDYDKSSMPILTESQIDEVFNGELVDDDLIPDHCTPTNVSSDTSIAALLGLMYKPLTFMDLTECCADLRVYANKCLSSLFQLRPNLLSPIYKRLLDRTCITEVKDDYISSITHFSYNETTISLATCSYLYRCERMITCVSFANFPQVLTHESLLYCHLPFIKGLLERTEILVHEKGLALLESILRHIEQNSLDQKFYDLFQTFSLHTQLFRIMVFSPLCTNRRKAYDMFICICDLLNYECKLKMFKHVITQTDLRPCVRAACIDQYRKHLTNVYTELVNFHQQNFGGKKPIKVSNCAISSVFNGMANNPLLAEIMLDEEAKDTDESMDIRGDDGEIVTVKLGPTRVINPAIVKKNLQTKFLRARYGALGGLVLTEFLDLCIKACLPEKQHTDIIENYELLLATLTLCRYLKLRKKTIFINELEEEYLSGKKLNKLFFNPIRKAIALIMSELKLHHREIVDGHKKKNRKKVTQRSILKVTQSRNELDLLSRIMSAKMEGLVDTKEVSEFNEEDEADCLKWALCRLDLVESVLVRTCDLYNC